MNGLAATPATTIAYVPGEGVFVLLGDLQAFEGRFENAEEAVSTFSPFVIPRYLLKATADVYFRVLSF